MIDFDRLSFWRNPAASHMPVKYIEHCSPDFYLDLDEVTELVCGTLQEYTKQSDYILELGSGTGRNLAGLLALGYTYLAGVEINPDAIDTGRKVWLDLDNVPMRCSAIEDCIETIEDYDCIFTQGVFQHLAHDADWIFPIVAKKAQRVLMTIENESPGNAVRSWGRNYKDIFEPLGWKQVHERTCEGIRGLCKATTLRVFKR